MRVWWVRAALGVVFVPVSLLVLGGGVMLLTAESVAGVLGFLLCLSLVLFIGLVWFVGTGSSSSSTTRGSRSSTTCAPIGSRGSRSP